MAGLLFLEKKKNLLRFDLKKPRDDFCRRGRGRSFQAEGPKTEKGTDQEYKFWYSSGWRYA